MYHFFVVPEQVLNQQITITGTDVNHIKNVLRMKIGEQVEISDGNNMEYQCRILELNAESVVLDILERQAASSELPVEVYLYQGLPKSDKMEWIIQKCVELGVHEVIPVAMKRCVVKLDEKKEASKRKRWQAVSESAAKQAGRSCIPQIHETVHFKDAVEHAAEMEQKFLPYELAEGMEETRKLLSGIEKGQKIAIFIGPEGGFETSEVEYAMEHGFLPLTLGKRILRTETAGMSILSVIGYLTEGK